MPSGPEGDEDRKHMQVVLAGPHGKAQQVAFVPICSIVKGHDSACIVEAWAHPWLSHDSFVDYRFAQLHWASKIETAIERGFFVEKEPADDWLVSEICAGIANSRRVKPFLQDFIDEWQNG